MNINFILLIVLFIFAYLVGSIPCGYWFSKYFFGVDITKNGSGNTGATNVARVLKNKYFFFLIFFLDAAKAYLFLLLGKSLLPNFWGCGYCRELLFLTSVFLLVGNAYSIFLKFKGGKGVATTFGILLVLVSPRFIIAFVAIWLITLALTRRVDKASVAALFISTVFYVIYARSYSWAFLFFLIFINLWFWFRHRENIKNFVKLSS